MAYIISEGVSVMKILSFLLLTISVVFCVPVSITVEYEGKRLKANAEWVVPEGIDPGKRGAVLWVHGLFQTHRMMEPVGVQRDLWVSAGFPVLSPTLTLGVDDRRDPYDCSYPLDHEFDLNFKEIEAWVLWLRSRGVERIVLAGHSLGGLQVIHTALRLKGVPLAGVVAVAPSKGTPREHPLLEKARRLYEAGKGKTLLETSFFYCEKTKVSARTLYTYYGVDRNVGKALKALEIPVLVVAGGEDTRVEDLPGFLEPYIGNKENVKVEVIDYADHFFRDLAAEDLAQIVVEFLREVLP
jgi:pimeloyl-ACP methyl ester carboxylesterase